MVCDCWRSDLLDIKALENVSFAITAQFVTKADGFVWWLSCVYDAPTKDGKKEFWLE